MTEQAEIGSQPIAALELSNRASRPLRLAGLETIGKLTSKTFLELWRIKGLGVQTMREITAALTARGLALRVEPDELEAQRKTAAG
jgi:DNA-directed RNA polymerase alpha subunit